MTGINSYVSPSTRYDWGTPDAVFEELDAEFGFMLDVCASPWNAKCCAYFTVEQDGLQQEWDKHVCWMNPPYGREIAKWMRKAYESSLSGATVVCLVPSRTDTAWWHDYAMKGEVRFIRGRIQFIRPDFKKDNAPFPNAIVVFRPIGSESASAKVERGTKS